MGKTSLLLLAAVSVGLADESGKKSEATAKLNAEIRDSSQVVFWRDPADIATRNLFYGQGGESHQPHGIFTFQEEDLDGTNPKLVVRDEDGTKWKVKMGTEARPETVASRFLWAVGYYANEDYFVHSISVEKLPVHLHRGQKYVSDDGAIQDVRMKRYLKGEKKIGEWSWENGPFAGTRELNGLRTLMAVMNNWDLKDVNNAIYQEKDRSGNLMQVYTVSDLGASFGTAGIARTHEISKGNVKSYSHSKFIRRVDGDTVDFESPGRATILDIADPKEFSRRAHLEWIGRNIPRADAKWMGQLLARLSPEQIRDAFRAAAYSPEEVEEFARVIESRIAELNQL
ncbi:MAG TPA: hypothetical protein VKT81_07075 [Bryobacteraceae bacterium]|nr:hypothetical protein [Bryobacteraceae bacterium]